MNIDAFRGKTKTPLGVSLTGFFSAHYVIKNYAHLCKPIGLRVPVILKRY